MYTDKQIVLIRVYRRPSVANCCRGLVLLLSGLLFNGCGKSGPPYEPKDALKTFRIEPGFRIENFISEPDIRSPAAMEWDEDGRIYVVENPGYPLNPEGKVGRVILLEDTGPV